MSPPNDFVAPGTPFGRLTVQQTYLKDYNGRRRMVAECTCDCGGFITVMVYSLRRKDRPTTSCGCYNRQRSKESATTHGLHNHPLRRVFDSMKARCYNPNHKSYKNYGGRGISISAEWIDDFMSFYEWSVAAGWEKGLQIDRIDNDGNYSPYNCRFVTPLYNNMNKRDIVMITAFGETKPLTHWERDPRTAVKLNALQHRIEQGMSAEDAITTPPRSNHTNNPREFFYSAYGEIKTAVEWEMDSRCQVAKSTFLRRYRNGCSFEEAISVPPNQVSHK